MIFDRYKWKLVDRRTTLSAKLIARHKSKHIITIASSTAAEIYGLKILAPKIQTLKNNYTDFDSEGPHDAVPVVDGQ